MEVRLSLELESLSRERERGEDAERREEGGEKAGRKEEEEKRAFVQTE